MKGLDDTRPLEERAENFLLRFGRLENILVVDAAELDFTGIEPEFRGALAPLVFFDTLSWSNPHVHVRSWYGKEGTTFSDMMVSVRRYLWMEWVFAQVPGGQAVQKLPIAARKLMDLGLTQAA